MRAAQPLADALRPPVNAACRDERSEASVRYHHHAQRDLLTGRRIG